MQAAPIKILSKQPDLQVTIFAVMSKLANDYQLESIVFPNISTGIYGYPKEKAACIAYKVAGRSGGFRRWACR